MDRDLIFGVIGGLGLFIYGMKLLSDGLQKVASTRLRKIILMFTNKPIMGIISGCLLTCIIQSSSATTVMTIGFVNSGMMLLRQAIGVVIGANIGTTITAQIIAFKISAYALPTIGIGCAMLLFGKKKRTQYWGQVLLGLGILFFGLTTMESVLKSLKNSPMATDFFIRLGKYPVFGILTGTLVTMIIQSSSASIGLVIALASNGLLDFQASIYLVLGDNIGTTITAWLASIGTNLSSRRVAASHSLFNLLGASIFGVLTYTGVYIAIVDHITPGDIGTATIARHIANSHTLFNVLNAILFFPFIPMLEKFVKLILPGQEEMATEPCYLEPHLLETPEIALSQSKKEMVRMLNVAREAFTEAMEGFFEKNRKRLKPVQKMEDTIDNLQSEITLYLIDISKNQLTTEQSEQLPSLLHSVNDIEKIGDHAENIMKVAERVIDRQMEISVIGIRKIKHMYKDIQDMFDIIITNMKLVNDGKETCVKNVFKIETDLNITYKGISKEQLRHFQQGKEFAHASIAFLDLINNMEKIGDHLTNIAEALRADFAYQAEYAASRN
ncbi:MAG: Na/Pi cotransporter family protein [Candidatus Auribacterota bacterium]